MIQKPIEDQRLVKHLGSLPPDGITIFLMDRGHFRAALVHGTRMVNRMRVNHDSGLLETLLLGHAYLAAVLLTMNAKGHDRIALDVSCTGPAGGLHVEATALGNVRGYLSVSPIPLEQPPESLDTAPLIGSGTLSVTKILEKAQRPFTGHISLENGRIAGDLARYFTISEQIPAAVNLSIQFDPDGRAIGAAGLFVQAFPGADATNADALNTTIQALPSLGRLVADGQTAESLIDEQFSAFSPAVLETRPVGFRCDCTKDRFGRFLAALPVDEIQAIRDELPTPVRTTCQNCNTTYEFTEPEIDEACLQAR